LRILYLTTEYPGLTKAGGIATETAASAKALSALGHEVAVLVCASGLERDDVAGDGFTLYVRPLWPGNAFRRFVNERVGAILAFALQYRRLDRPFDVVQAPEYMAPLLLLSPSGRTSLVTRLSTPTVVTFESNDRGRSLKLALVDLLERWALKRADVLAAPSEFLVRRLRARGWLGARQVSVVPTPIDTEAWSGLRSADTTEPLVLAVGRVDPNKGPDVVVEAAAKLKESVPAIRVVFAGRSEGMLHGRPCQDAVTARAEELGVCCVFAGERTREELRQFYADARVVVIASRHDAWSNVGLEALACGRPLVASTGTGISELVQRLDPEAVFPTGDRDRLATALSRYLTDPAHAAAVGRAGQELVAAFSPMRAGRQWERLYEDAVRMKTQ
jgi:glycogen(starch) synthase